MRAEGAIERLERAMDEFARRERLVAGPACAGRASLPLARRAWYSPASWTAHARWATRS